MKRLNWIQWSALGGLIAIAVSFAWPFLTRPPHVEVFIHNTGTSPLKSAVVEVMGQRRLVGDIPPNKIGRATVGPTDDFPLTLEFTDSTGTVHRLDEGDYLEPGDRVTIRVSADNGVVVEHSQARSSY
jgi:hypothetical protein